MNIPLECSGCTFVRCLMIVKSVWNFETLVVIVKFDLLRELSNSIVFASSEKGRWLDPGWIKPNAIQWICSVSPVKRDI